MLSCPRFFVHRGRAVLAACALLLALAVPASAQEKKYGYDSKVGGGNGAAFSGAERLNVQGAIDKIKDLTLTTKDQSYDGGTIAADLQKMLDDGRMGKGVGAKKNTNAITLPDGKVTADGDKMNIADHYVANADNKKLSKTLMHEWLHTVQALLTEAEMEAPAYQLSKAGYLAKGGDAADETPKKDEKRAEEYKKEIENARPVVPDSKAPAAGGDKHESNCGHSYYLDEEPGRVYFWDNAHVDTVIALPNQLFYTMMVFPHGPCDRVLIFGTDRTTPSNPIGTLTVVDAGPSGFLSRQNLTLPGLRYPFSVTRDATSGKFYVLDAHFSGVGIVSMVDLNADHIPDSMQPFASRSFPGVNLAESIDWAEIPGVGNGLALDEMDAREDDCVALSEGLTLIRDTNNDGLADFSAPIAEIALGSYPPHFTRPTQPGENSVEVQAMPGHQVQIWLTDENGDFNLSLIGTAIGASNGHPQIVPVFPPLPPQQYVKAVDATDNTQGPVPDLIRVQSPGASPALLVALAALLGSAGVVMARRRERNAG